jgi:DinB family protein
MSIFTNSAARSVEEAADYTRAVLGLLGEQDPLEVLRGTPSAVRLLVDDTAPQMIGVPEAEGKWSIRMVAQHLADAELVWGWRLRMIFAQDRPTITGYDQDAWATRLQYSEAVIEHALDDFEHLRGSNLRLIARMPEEDRSRVGVHAERGEESVAHLMRLYAGHDLLHLRQIERIKKAVAASA